MVSADDEESFKYASQYCQTPLDIEVFRVRKNTDPKYTAPYNLYLNTLIKNVKEGWILIIDDDDYLGDRSTLKYIMTQINRYTNHLVLFQMMWPNGRLIPSNELLGKEPVRKQIGMPCFMVHSNFKNLLHFDGMKAGDFRLIKKLYEVIDKKIVLNYHPVQIGNTGNYGKREDIK